MRRHKYLEICAAILLLCGVTEYCKAQAVTYGMGELNIISSMRSMALGGATVAMDGYPGAAQINPASIGLNHVIQGSSYFFGDGHGSIFGRQFGYGSVGLYQPNFDYRSDRWAAALLTTYNDFGGQTETDAQGNIIGRFRYYRLGISGSGSWELSPDLRVGFGLRYITSHPLPSYYNTVGATIAHNAHSIAIDVGLLYKRSFETEFMTLRPSAGWSLTNFGSPLRYSSINGDPLPMTMRGGIGLRFISKEKMYNRPIFSVGIYGELSHILAREDTSGNLYGPFKALFKGWGRYTRFDGQNLYRITTWDQLERQLGLEASLFDIVSVRWGIDYESPKIMLSNGMTHSWGLGLDFYYLALDYTTIKYDSQKTAFEKARHIWQATVRIPLSSSPRNFWPEILKKIGIY